MTAAAPAFRRVCQLSGDIADRPSKFFAALNDVDIALADADDAAETIGNLLAENAALRARVDELEAEHITDSSAAGADDPAADRAAPGARRPGAAHPTP